MTESRTRLPFLDGIRGLACLYVLLFHALNTVIVPSTTPLPQPLRLINAIGSRGNYGVVVFIVLSGFSIMLPIARSGTNKLPGGLSGYVRRRGRRILPPYYAALLFSIFIIVGFNTFGQHAGLGGKIPSIDLSGTSVLSHVFLVQNYSANYVNRINGPMWSVSTEWMIYFLFALLLLPLMRRTNAVVVAVVACVLACLPHFLLPTADNFDWAYPWLLGSFALGALGAVIGFSPKFLNSKWRSRAPWATLTLVFLVVVILLALTNRDTAWPFPIVELIVSVFAICLINACWAPSVRHVRGAHSRNRTVPRGLLAAFLGSRWLVYLGGFSYSIYLIQAPILHLAGRGLLPAHLSRTVFISVSLLVVVPFVMAVGWLFAEFFERPLTGSGILLPALRRRFRTDRQESPGIGLSDVPAMSPSASQDRPLAIAGEGPG